MLEAKRARAWYVYIVQSLSSGELTSGITTNPARCLDDYSKGKLPVKPDVVPSAHTYVYLMETKGKSEAEQYRTEIEQMSDLEKLTLSLQSPAHRWPTHFLRMGSAEEG